jgi:hypothetical protein
VVYLYAQFVNIIENIVLYDKGNSRPVVIMAQLGSNRNDTADIPYAQSLPRPVYHDISWR